MFNIIRLHVNIILIVSFVSFTLFIFSLFLFCFLLSLAFSSRFLFVSLSVCSSRSISFSPSNVSISFLTFLLLLGSLFIFDFFSFPLLLLLPSPISLFFSFPVWVFLLSPLVPLSRIFCSLSATLVFPFLPFSPFPQFTSSSFVSVSFPVPSSPLLAASSSYWSVLSPICCDLFDVFLFPVSLLSLFSSFFSVLFASFLHLLHLSLFLSPPPLLPPFYFLDVFLSASLASSSFSASLSSASLFRFPSVSSSAVSSFGSVAFCPPPGFPPLPLHLVSILFLLWFSSASRLLFSLGFCLQWFSSAHPLVCRSCSVV